MRLLAFLSMAFILAAASSGQAAQISGEYIEARTVAHAVKRSP